MNGDKYESHLHFQYYADCPCQFIIWIIYVSPVLGFFPFFFPFSCHSLSYLISNCTSLAVSLYFKV